MKVIVAFLLIAAIGYCAYRFHKSHLDAATEEAARTARQQALEDAARRTTIAISRELNSLYTQVMADLDLYNQPDYVPYLKRERDRILDKRETVESTKKAIYDLAQSLVDGIIAVGEERNKANGELLKVASARPNSLDATSGRRNATASFFAEGIVKRWNDQRAQRKPTLDAQFEKLKQAEREWNQNAAKIALGGTR